MGTKSDPIKCTYRSFFELSAKAYSGVGGRYYSGLRGIAGAIQHNRNARKRYKKASIWITQKLHYHHSEAIIRILLISLDTLRHQD